MKKIVKLTTPWDHDFMTRTPHSGGVFGEYKFEIDNDCDECDYWIVWGGVGRITKVKCPPENILFVTDETHSERRFETDFLQQFPTVVACRTDLVHPHIVKSHDLGIWHFKRSYDQVVRLEPMQKTKRMSVVASNLMQLEGHRRRVEYVRQLRKHFGDAIDYFGRGTNEVSDKYEALVHYKYSIAIENSSIEGYFTEKLFECFLTYTLPVYYGCPDLTNYFDERSFIRIDILNPEGSFKVIEDLLREDIYESRLPYLIEARRLFMEKYYFFPSVINVIKTDELLASGKKVKRANILRPEQYFKLSRMNKVIENVKYLKDRINQ